ncbi:MAG: alanine--tRNA ligase [Candidatus Diapherotrites archaeon]|nr:alanine--tRNA ligase [Candidatus Diapherotrites archaeon]
MIKRFPFFIILMLTDKQIKSFFREEASKNPEKYYPVQLLKEKGFYRKQCKKCGKYFWSVNQEREFCGDSSCVGGYSFIGNSPATKKFDYLESWYAFRDFFKKKDYYEYKRYPVVARWRDDVYWVGASVYPFQPWVVNGLSKPKSNAVIIPQLSLRFNDVDNVGITGSHYVCFDMLGQLHFEEKKNYRPELYFEEYFEWINKGMGIPIEEIILHEDAWAGASFFGPCIEFFSRGCEIGNQVYMQYRATETGYEELAIKVLDMGQGHERIPWFTQGISTSYETTFPTVVKYLKQTCSVEYDDDLLRKFLPYAAYLNVDEAEDIQQAWNFVANKIGVNTEILKQKILPLVAIYAVAEHSRASLVALNDGALPSNVGGGYNLRVVMRRMFSFIDKYSWDINIEKLFELHAHFLKPMYPELTEYLENSSKIVENEYKKFLDNRKRSKAIIESCLCRDIDNEKLVELYDSHGIEPEHVLEEAKKLGKSFKIPDNFYALVAERHSLNQQQTSTKKEVLLDIKNLSPTKILYYFDWKFLEFEATVLSVQGCFVVLDKSAFYPTSGGQLHDIGKLNDVDVLEVIKQDDVILHKVKDPSKFKVGDIVFGKVDFERRKQLTQHHSAAHLINLSARKVLGPHVYQAGAAKTLEKARLDITHYEIPPEKDIKIIENVCNEIIKENLTVYKEVLPRETAEDLYGTRIYQGGAVPGRNIRIVKIGDDVEACGGTHVNSTAEIEGIKIISVNKVQDGVIRINFVAGKAARKMLESKYSIIEEAADLLGVDKKEVPKRAEELFNKWKKVRKEIKKGKKPNFADFELTVRQKIDLSDEELVEYTAKILQTQPHYLVNTIKKFLSDLEEIKKKNLVC